MNTKPAAWYSWRRTGVGSSDAPAVAGVSPYKGRADVYWDKVNPQPQREDIPAPMEWGTRLESAILDKVEEELGWRVVRPDGMALYDMVEPHKALCFQCPARPWQLASLDGALEGQPEMVEAKTARADYRTKGGQRVAVWGPSASNQVPPDYYVQVQHQLAVTGWRKCHLAVLIGGSDFRLYEILPDLELIATLVRLEEQFWTTHVLKQVPPEGAIPESVLQVKMPDVRRIETVQAGSWDAALLESYRDLCAQRDAAVAAQEGTRNELQRLLAERGITGISLEGVGQVTWTPTKGHLKTDWEAVAKAMTPPATLIQQHTQTTEGHWTFRAKWDDKG